ncbi:unnamed protein product, partial [Polarella glacialis]
CQLLSPSGIHLANVSSRKATWYVSQGLGEQLDSGVDDKMVVKLKFEPKGVGHAGDEFYLQVMENRCVGCASVERLVRFSIVPHVFRSQLPARFKEHSSHDIVLLCHACYVPASEASQAMRSRLLMECSIAECNGLDVNARRFHIDDKKMQARGAASALRHPHLPHDVRLAKEAVVREFLGIPDDVELTPDDVEAARTMDPK